MEQGEPETKRFKHSIISEHMYEPEFQELFFKHWHGRSSIRTSNLEVIAEPFRVCKISNFLKNEEFMDDLKNELVDVKSRRNSIDLYQFEQSSDLSKVASYNIKLFYETFQTDLVSWMEKNTKIELNKKLSMSSSCYSDTDYLLCHDDNLGDRRIAFILYLSKNWTKEDGGTLDLFDTDENGHPRRVVKSLIPEYNSLVFFEVVDNSYHQVAEIISPIKSRWSINGWFHGPVVEAKKPRRRSEQLILLEPEMTEINLNSWISEVYLNPDNMEGIQEDIEKDSFAFLKDFLLKDRYEALSEELKSDSIKWKRVGPADSRNYEVAETDSLPKTLADFYKLFTSITIFQLLKNYTELDLVPDGESMNPKMTIELQRWTRGCYTLLTDRHTYEDAAPATVDSEEPIPSKADTTDVAGDAPSSSEIPRQQSNYTEESSSSDKELSKDTGYYTLVTDKHTYEDAAPATVDSEKSTPSEADTTDLAGDAPSSSEIPRRQSNYTAESSSNDKELSKAVGVITPSSSPDDDEELDLTEARKRKNKEKSPRVKDKRPMVEQSSLSNAEQQEQQQQQRDLRNTDTDDSDVSDIGDYLSDPLDCTSEGSDNEGSPQEAIADEQEPDSLADEQEPDSLADEQEPDSLADEQEPGSLADEQEPGGLVDEQEHDSLADADEQERGTVVYVDEPGTLDVIMQFHTTGMENETIDYVDLNEHDGALITIPPKDNHLCIVYKTVGTARVHKYLNHYFKGTSYNLVCTYQE